MGESTHEWTKKQKISRKQITVCEDCGQQWTATLAEVPVTIFIKDLDEYYKKLEKNLIEAVDPPMVLCVFRPSAREIQDTEITLSCIAPRQETPYNWRINHKHKGPAAISGCQIIPMRCNAGTNAIESSSSQQEMVTIKEEIKEEVDEIIEEMIPDPLAVDKDIKPDVNSLAVPIIMASTIHGKLKPIVNGYEYMKYKACTTYTRYQCVQSRRKCYARISITKQEPYTVVEFPKKEHNHPPKTDGYIKALMARQRMKEQAASGIHNTHDIFSKEVSQLPEDALPYLASKESCKRNIRNIARKKFLATPITQQELILRDEWRQTLDGEDWLIYGTPKDKID